MSAIARHTTTAMLGLVFGAALVACGGAKGDRDGAMAKALDNSKAGASKEADGQRMKELKAKAEEDAKKAYDKELETITSLNPPLPPDLDAACADAGAGLDAFMQKRLAGDELGRWDATKEPDMRRTTEECRESGKIEWGACVSKGLREASIGQFANGSQGEIKAACTKRYNSGIAQAAAGG